MITLCGMKRLFFLPLASLGLAALGSLARAECFDEHLRAAIQTNQSRLEPYSLLSDGRTKPLSQELIGLERQALFVSKWYMARTRRFREAGVGLFCSEFLPMSRAGDLVTEPLSDRPQLSDYRKPRWEDLEKELSATLQKMDETLRSPVPEAIGILWWDLQARLESELLLLKPELRFNCMYRHVVESMLIVSREAVKHAKQAQALGLENPEPWSISLLKLHLQALEPSIKLDQRAAPIQADGIPFLCSDVPHL